MATLFFEPSTRTRLSFESAMLRLGGGCHHHLRSGAVDEPAPRVSRSPTRCGWSAATYADILVIRHPERRRRSGRRAATPSVPVINGGDGAHEHPTQTLCDLYTLWKREGSSCEELDVVLCGDLRYSRTVHSFAYALARFGANIVTLPVSRLRDAGVRSLESAAAGPSSACRRSTPPSVGELPWASPTTEQLGRLPHLEPAAPAGAVHPADAAPGRPHRRHLHDPGRSASGTYGESTEGYPRICRASSMRAEIDEATSRVMHPLPRTDEIAYELDSRSALGLLPAGRVRGAHPDGADGLPVGP